MLKIEDLKIIFLAGFTGAALCVPHTATASVVSSSNLSRTSPFASTAALHFHDHSQHTFLLHIFLILIFEQEINRYHVVGRYEEPGVMFCNGVDG